MTTSGELRQRKKKKKSSPSSPKRVSSDKDKKDTAKKNDGTAAQEPTLREVFLSHPLGFCLVRVLPWIVVTYGMYIGYYFVALQHPDWISKATGGLVQLRPAISVTDPRQMLIVGTMSSGTTQVTSDLSSTLRLEIGHEDSDASWNFVRDGTVSWFHGIRFLQPHASSQEKLETFKNLCMNYTFNMGYHPQMYKHSSKCSSRFSQNKWNACWTRECMDVIQSEWGCALTDSCETKFATTLLQVRNPLRTMESLVAKFCVGGMDGKVHSSFTRILHGLFPNTIPEHLSCIEAAAFYVVNYTNALLQAQDGGLLDGMYRIETSSPCDVANLAGLFNETATLYPPNHDLVRTRCIQQAQHAAQKVMTSSKHQINIDLVKLTWSDLDGGKHGSQRSEGSTDVAQSVKDLFSRLGYNVVEEADADDPVFDF